MKLKQTLLLSLALLTQVAHAQQDVAATIESLFARTSLDAMLEVASETKSERYTEFATLFNYCQKLPNDDKCGKEYNVKRENYEVAKANHDVLIMAQDPEFIGLLMPASNYPELVHALKALGYLSVESSAKNAKHEQVMVALNRWLEAHNFSKTEQIYFMHALLVRTEELSKQLIEQHSAQSSSALSNVESESNYG
jgi:hypothetical protein